MIARQISRQNVFRGVRNNDFLDQIAGKTLPLDTDADGFPVYAPLSRLAGGQNSCGMLCRLFGSSRLEAGNSPRMVFSNYREIVRRADGDLPTLKLRPGRKVFGITPEEAVAAAKAARQNGAASKIVALPVVAAA